MSLENVLSAFPEAKQQHDGRYLATCPSHDDARPSLGFWEDESGWVRFKCRSQGCSRADILAGAGLNLVDVGPDFPSTNGHKPASVPAKDHEAKRWRVGTFLHIRFEDENGAKTKVAWASLDGRLCSPGKGPKTAELPLYGVETLNALPDSSEVYLVEGEKCADALHQAGLASVATVTGATTTPSDVSLSPLVRFSVVAWPDADLDGAGQRHMDRIATRLNALGCQRINVLTWPDAPPKGDAADYLAELHHLGLPRVDIAAAVATLPRDTYIPPVNSANARPTIDPREGGAGVLSDVERFLARFVVYPSQHARVAHVLWIAHTHRMNAWESTPRIAFLSPEPSSGKTRALEISELLVPRPVLAVNCTSAYLFRRVSDPGGPPTILFDEIDTLFGPRAKSEHEDVRGLLNAGHRKGAVAGRCVVKNKGIETEELPAYAAVALAGLGDLPDTLMARSVVVRMRRRAPGELVQPFRRRECEQAAATLRDSLAAFAETIRAEAWPEMPVGVTDRNADVWEPLLAVADAAGGDWPKRARVSCVTHVTLSMGGTPSLGVRLLGDLRTVFGEREHMLTAEILTALNGMDDAPWGDLRGKPLDARGLSRRLANYGVAPRSVRLGSVVGKGYSRADLFDPWSRYLDPCVTHLEGRAIERDRGEEGGHEQAAPDVGTPRQERVTRETSDTAPETAFGTRPNKPCPNCRSGTWWRDCPTLGGWVCTGCHRGAQPGGKP